MGEEHVENIRFISDKSNGAPKLEVENSEELLKTLSEAFICVVTFLNSFYSLFDQLVESYGKLNTFLADVTLFYKRESVWTFVTSI